MIVHVLDMESKDRKELLRLLLENKSVGDIKVFEDSDLLIDQVIKSKPDFCFIRLGKDGIPGFKTARIVQLISQNIRIVFVSNSGKYAVNAYDVGAYGYLTYPLEKEKLERTLLKP